MVVHVEGPHIAHSVLDLFESDAAIQRRLYLAAKGKSDTSGHPIRLLHKLLSATDILTPFVGQMIGQEETEEPSMIIGNSFGTAQRVMLKSGRVICTYSGHKGPISSVLLFFLSERESPLLLTGSWDKKIRLFSITGSLLVEFEGHHDYVQSLSRHPTDANLFLSGSADGSLKIWNLSTHHCTASYKIHARSIEAILTYQSTDPSDHNDPICWTASSDNSIQCVRLTNGTIIKRLSSHLTSVYCMAFDEDCFYSGSADNKIIKWDLDGERKLAQWTCPDWVKSIALMDSYLFAGTRIGQLVIIDTDTDESIIRIVDGHTDEIASIKIFEDIVYTISLDGTLRRWSIKNLLEGERYESSTISTKNEISSYATVEGTHSHDNVKNSVLTLEEEEELEQWMA